MEAIQKSKKSDLTPKDPKCFFDPFGENCNQLRVQKEKEQKRINVGQQRIKIQKQIVNNQRQEKFILDQKEMDNNNGILVIDIKEDGKIKYGLACGYEDIDNGNFDMITAKEYFDVSQDNCSDEYKLINTNKELYDKVLKQVEYIDNNFELLTQDEYDEIFKKEYNYKDCLRKEVLNNENERI